MTCVALMATIYSLHLHAQAVFPTPRITHHDAHDSPRKSILVLILLLRSRRRRRRCGRGVMIRRRRCPVGIRRGWRRWPGRWPEIPNRRRFEWSGCVRRRRRRRWSFTAVAFLASLWPDCCVVVLAGNVPRTVVKACGVGIRPAFEFHRGQIRRRFARRPK